MTETGNRAYKKRRFLRPASVQVVPEEPGAVPHAAGVPRGRGRRRRGPVGQHAVAVSRASGMREQDHVVRRRLHAAGRRQSARVRRRRGAAAGRQLLSGTRRDRGRPGGQAGGVRVRGRVRRLDGVREGGDRGRGRRGQLEIPGDARRLRAVDHMPRGHHGRLRRAVQPAQRPRLLRHVLRGLSARVVRLPAGRPVDAARDRLDAVQTLRYVSHGFRVFRVRALSPRLPRIPFLGTRFIKVAPTRKYLRRQNSKAVFSPQSSVKLRS